MTLGLPNFGITDVPPFNPLIYPKRVLIAGLENIFSQQNLVTFTGSTPNPFLYIPEGQEPNKSSKLVIADTYSQELKKTDSRPTIIIGRGALQFTNSAINSRRDSFSLLRSTSPEIGLDSRINAKYSDMVAVPISINCYSRNASEVEQLAWMVGGILKFFKQQIKDGARIHKIEAPTIGPVSPVKADSKIDLFLINITLMMYQTVVWETQTTASVADISAGLVNLSGSAYPKVWNNIATEIIPEEISDDSDLIDRWLSP
jgi:hypothetical protein